MAIEYDGDFITTIDEHGLHVVRLPTEGWVTDLEAAENGDLLVFTSIGEVFRIDRANRIRAN